jgi:nitroreductase
MQAETMNTSLCSAGYDSLLEVMRRRRSIRSFRPDPVPDGLVDRILEAARWAPSAGNRQAHRFLVVTSREKIGAMAQAVEAATQRLADHLRADLAEQVASYLANFRHFVGAPVVLVAIYRTGFDLLRAVTPSGSAGELPGAKPVVDALASVSAAIMNLLLAAHVLGLGACWMTGPLVAAGELMAILEVPRGWEIAALVPVGFPAETPPATPRRTLDQLVRRID